MWLLPVNTLSLLSPETISSLNDMVLANMSLVPFHASQAAMIEPFSNSTKSTSLLLFRELMLSSFKIKFEPIFFVNPSKRWAYTAPPLICTLSVHPIMKPPWLSAKVIGLVWSPEVTSLTITSEEPTNSLLNCLVIIPYPSPSWFNDSQATTNPPSDKAVTDACDLAASRVWFNLKGDPLISPWSEIICP